MALEHFADSTRRLANATFRPARGEKPVKQGLSIQRAFKHEQGNGNSGRTGDAGCCDVPCVSRGKAGPTLSRMVQQEIGRADARQSCGAGVEKNCIAERAAQYGHDLRELRGDQRAGASRPLQYLRKVCAGERVAHQAALLGCGCFSSMNECQGLPVIAAMRLAILMLTGCLPLQMSDAWPLLIRRSFASSSIFNPCSAR